MVTIWDELIGNGCFHSKDMNAFQKCFAGDNLVTLGNGEKKKIIDVNIGDHVKAVDWMGKLIDTQVVSILHKNSNATSKI